MNRSLEILRSFQYDDLLHDFFEYYDKGKILTNIFVRTIIGTPLVSTYVGTGGVFFMVITKFRKNLLLFNW